MKEMGFNDDDLIFYILNQCDGNIEKTLNILTEFN